MKLVGRFLLPLLVLILPLGFYIKTLAATYIPIDSAEFALCIKFWGICHPPGFPLYTAVGKLFVELWPSGSLIFKANLLSAIFASLTLFFVYLTLSVLKVSKLVSFLLTFFLAVSATFWEFAVSADVFSLATFLTALTFFLAFKYKPYWAFFTLGLFASHFYISVVLWPFLFWYFWPALYRGAGFWRRLIISGLVFALGFFPQGLMYLRMQQGPEINWGHAQGFGGFVDFARRREFGSIFLLSNPLLTFSLIKVFKHFYAYFASLLTNFGVILPLLVPVYLIFGRKQVDRRVILIILSWVVLLTVQLVLLSTIDPLEKNSPFQLNKFYLTSFILAVFLMGKALEWSVEKFLAGSLVPLVLVFLVIVYTLASFRTNDLSINYFSQNLVYDAFSQLEPGSLAITVSHVVYFGGLYEQKVNGRFGDMTIFYFPNEKNRDNEGYHPEFFTRNPDWGFVKKIEKDKNLGNAERYILETIARNRDKPIYILQGSFEEGFFGYLKPYIEPYGLWWRLKVNPYQRVDVEVSKKLLGNLRNGNVKRASLHQRQQADDSLTYAVSYHSTAIALASAGKLDEAIEFLNLSLSVNPEAESPKREIELILATGRLEERTGELMAARDKSRLIELGNNYFTLGNFEACREVFENIIKFDSEDATSYNNLASCLASVGKKDEARANYLKALDLDPKLELARRGLEALRND